MGEEIFTPGFRFKDGKLYLFTTERVMLIQGWPEPNAVTKTRNMKDWRAFAPEFRLVRPYRPRATQKKRAATQLSLFGPEQLEVRQPGISEQRKRAFDSFRFSLPKPVARVLQDFQRHQWEALLMMSKYGKPAQELFASNPVLAFCLAHHRRFRPHQGGTHLPDGIVQSKQRDIMRWLELPASNAAVNVLSKITPESITLVSPNELHDVLTDSAAAKLLAHVPKVNAGVLALVGDSTLRLAVTPKVMQEVAADKRQKYQPQTARLLEQVLHMHHALTPDEPAPRFRSLERLQGAHDVLSVEYLRHTPPRVRGKRLPKPPVRGTADIVPITEYGDLVQEGKTQKNCVASYADRVLARTTYIYKVLRPERATLSLLRTPSGSWVRGDLLQAGNRPVATRTAEMVEDWLLTHSMRLG